TGSGTVLTADLVFLCLGGRVNSAYLRNNFSAQLDERGYVKVNSHLQMEGFPNIFVVGDLPNVQELKLTANTDSHARVATSNLKALANGESLTETYSGGPIMSAVPLGEKKGASQLPPFGGLVIGSWATSMLKGKDLFTTRYRKELGQKG
ncbi:MAG: FAD-dependent oxidoreductase, partial [Chloroflexota bacterium]